MNLNFTESLVPVTFEGKSLLEIMTRTKSH